ncbi:SPOR domain-containing protein [Granulicella arctica]|uniref:SPOR domain-containing protein n=1 Tax=Granulicella arctica TaxID=940613 RepID=UPI0021E08FDF|nr:SPOR domain-containing protein [Granulicella arctica]
MNIDNDRLDSDGNDREREISLGTATILGIFLALALVCAAFFGFGYSLGRHSIQAAAPIAPEVKADAAPEPKPDSPFSHFKQSTPPAPKPVTDPDTETPEGPVADTTPSPRSKPTETTAHPVAFPSPTPSAVNPVNPPVAAAGQFVVQISAPSRQGDADALLAALSRKGYKAYIRKEPQDSFFHVQVGPYATKPEAQAIAKRLDSDGYKPFIK